KRLNKLVPPNLLNLFFYPPHRLSSTRSISLFKISIIETGQCARGVITMIEILTPDEVAELLRVSSNRVVLLARRGEIPFLTVDGRLRFDARDVEDWLRSQRSNALAMPPRVVNTTGSK